MSEASFTSTDSSAAGNAPSPSGAGNAPASSAAKAPPKAAPAVTHPAAKQSKESTPVPAKSEVEMTSVVQVKETSGMAQN